MISGATYREGVAYSPDGAMYVTATGTAAITGGTVTGTNAPYVVARSAIPFIHISTGSVAANGALSGITALPAAYASAYCYFPANIVATVAAAGWYYCTFSTTTAGTVFLNTYTSGTPTVPSSPTAVTDGKGAYTGDTSSRTAQAITIPGGSMGPNGALRLTSIVSVSPSNANVKNAQLVFGATTFHTAQDASQLSSATQITIMNRGSQSSQVCASADILGGFGRTGSSASTFAANNTATDLTAAVSMSKATATDNVVSEGYIFEVMYGA